MGGGRGGGAPRCVRAQGGQLRRQHRLAGVRSLGGSVRRRAVHPGEGDRRRHRPAARRRLRSRTRRPGEIKIPEIPAGPNRVVEVRGYDSDPKAGGTVVSMGKSLPFDVPDVVPPDLGGPHRGQRLPAQGERLHAAQLGRPRRPPARRCPWPARATPPRSSGRSGQVFIAGGYNLERRQRRGPRSPTPRSSTRARARSRRRATCRWNNGVRKLPKAFHTATTLPSGQVMLWGGERYANAGGNPNSPSPTTAVLIYDPDVDDYGAFAEPPHHADPALGGDRQEREGADRRRPHADSQSWCPSTRWSGSTRDQQQLQDRGRRQPAAGRRRRRSRCATDEFIAVAGGTRRHHGSQTEVVFFKFDGTAFAQQPISQPPRLAIPVAARSPPARSTTAPTWCSWAATPTPRPSSRSTPRRSSRPIARAVASGPDGRQARRAVRGDPPGRPGDGHRRADDGRDRHRHALRRDDAPSCSARGRAAPRSVGGPSLAVPRYGHTCTVLLDGTVLVTGGINESGGTQTILSDAFIYQPPPAD